jgi:hypothetical protein
MVICTTKSTKDAKVGKTKTPNFVLFVSFVVKTSSQQKWKNPK